MPSLRALEVMAVAMAAALLGTANGLQMPRWFGDNLVLQTNAEYGSRSFLNGIADPGEHIDVQIGKASFPVVADSSGAWEIEANHASGDITVTGEKNDTLTAKNASGGDVFFCSGQSNMVFPMDITMNSTAEMATLNKFPNFRFFMTALDYADTPQFDLKPDPSECDSSNQTKCAMKCPVKGMCNRWVTAEEALANNATYLKEFSAVCFMTVRDLAEMHVGQRPVGLVFSAWGGTRVEAWMSTKAINEAASLVAPPAKVLPPPKPEQNNVSVLYNAMVAPFNKLSVRAALWYQGEANADQHVDADASTYYAQYLQAMIKDWRDLKGMGDFSFGVVMLPPSLANTANMSIPGTTGRPQIRLGEQQVAPHPSGQTDISGVAVTSDLGGKSAWGYDHPPNKNEISRRLALQMVHAAYAKQGRIQNAMPGGNGDSLWTGPILQSVVPSSTSIVISLANWSAAGLRLKDVVAFNIDGSNNSCINCCAKAPPFEVLYGDAWQTVAEKNTVVNSITSTVTLTTAGSKVKGVRYAYRDYVDCILVNNDSLPLAPFVFNFSSSQDEAVPASEAKISSSDDVAIKSPPMGFNSWNFYHCNIDENIVKQIADTFVSNGMAAVNYSFVNIDDCWQVARDPDTGEIIPDPVRFPSGMKALTDYVHSKGLKFGLYTARGSGTCQSRPGSLNYELIDAATYCKWGIDYIKIDRCQGAQSDGYTSWSRFHNGIEKCHNDTGHWIVQSVESCDSPDSGCGLYVTEVANLWRTGGDVQNFWKSIIGNIHTNDRMADVAKPGHFNDPDMLQVGNVGLDPDEQRSHFALWCIAGAPLLAGTDLVHASAETLEILSAPELIMVNQDLGVDGHIQGKFLGPCNASSSSAQTAAAAVMAPCDGSAEQVWEAVSTQKSSRTAPSGPVHLRQKSSGGILTVPGCARAVIPHGYGPKLTIENASTSSECGGKNTLWTFQSNGTLTTEVDGQCANVVQSNTDVQTFDCATQGMQQNGQFKLTPAGNIKSVSKCLSSSHVSSSSELWAKHLSSGATALLLLNLDDNNEADLTVSWSQINMTGTLKVRDLRLRKDLGTFADTFTAKAVPPHGSIMLSVSA